MKHYPLLIALLMALSYLAFGAGCCWEEPVDAGEVGAAPAMYATTAITAITTQPELSPVPTVLVVECDVFADGKYWAEAQFPAYTWQELSNVVAVAHYAGSYYPSHGYDHEQRIARVQDGKALVSCEGAVDYVIFTYVE